MHKGALQTMPNKIWFDEFPLDLARSVTSGSIMERLGIEITEAGDDYLCGRMPVDHRTIQPAGVLHGGASVTLAETLASWGAGCCVDRRAKFCVGQEINANHVRAVRKGWVYGIARPLHMGRASHVWEVHITSDEGKLVCISRVTLAILDGPMQLPH
jgi:1,4-dihydroxy-2-naphthoyl-CoA hydrolase